MKIYNHISYPLSENDMKMVVAIPPGGNWMDIPLSIPSKRLEGIRNTGGRTTLYGRLQWDKPSYTITTYFNRPGNGAYIHPKSDRVLSAREAARLQSFPDSFIFEGTKTSLTKQIGNAVPPLFAYAIAKQISKHFKKLNTLDLFCGAGGLSEGFKWAGFKTIVANDNFASACLTFKLNNPKTKFIEGDITNKEVQNQIFNEIKNTNIDMIMGGPPCQGFSYAGKRMINDPRNFLYKEFVKIVEKIKPKIFLMENVEGILTSNKGKTYESIVGDFSKMGYSIHAKKMHTAQFGVPQKRKRVIIIGILEDLKVDPKDCFPQEYTKEDKLFTTTKEAISDLPTIESNGGSHVMSSSKKSKSDYQDFMRGDINVSEYIKKLLRKLS